MRTVGAVPTISTPSTPAIDIRDLVKTFGPTRALDGLTLSVQTGQVHGFLGPNGAGKSTTIRVLLGLLRADSGSVSLLGGDPWSQAPELHRRLAYVPGDVNLWPNLTGGEAIDLLGRARGGLDPRRRDELIEAFDLDPRKKGRAYSKGNRQKVALVAALAADVELLLLDEPTSGLDPLMERVFTDIIRADRDNGRTVLLSSHILSEVEALCDHVSIVKDGRIVESGTLDDLRHLRRTQVVAELADAVPADLAQLPGVHDLTIDEHSGEHGATHRLTCQVDATGLDPLLGRLSTLGLRSLVSTPPTLEELFLQHYQRAEARDDQLVRVAVGPDPS
ncbi:ABC transporter ATP-binding protein [Arsenicicoccus piscis]|uniref:Tetronasin ABC transporter ATP-binding protein n=1 Tax=Arsenicicoccus piscis TaxID=673954 RepID=A0ABQ6HSI2_9MICO|nr:tetronasin ABC transporter ATP-binding protein [Arsenicicoccus piscis]